MPRCPTCHRRLRAGARCAKDDAIPPSEELVPRQAFSLKDLAVPGYTLGDVLGAGGFAVVATATDDQSQAEVAIKIALRKDRVGAQRFAREARAMQEIGAPRVPTLYDLGWLDEDRAYIVMERLRGQSLSDTLIELEEPMPFDRACALVDELLGVLEDVHRRGWVHRDLKPDNIFLAENALKLLDFGLVRVIEDDGDLTQEGSFLGTSDYAAPEQLTGASDVTARADLYAVGVVLYELLTLRPPFVGFQTEVEHGHIAMRPPDPRTLAPIPGPIADLVLDLLAKDPEKRPSDAAAVRQRLSRAVTAVAKTLGQRDATPTAAAPARTAIRTDGRRPVVLLVVEGRGDLARLGQTIGAHAGFVARQRGRMLTAAFIGSEANPVESAIQVAQDLQRETSARAAIHLSALSVRTRRNGSVRVFGPDVDDASRWLPPDWEGLVLTQAVAQTLDQDTVEPSEGGFYTLRRTPRQRRGKQETPFVGQEACLEAAKASFVASTEGSQSRLFTLSGESGSGKSRMLSEVDRYLRQDATDAKLYRIRARRAVAGDTEQPLRRLLRACLMLPQEANVADVTLACKVQLGKVAAEEVLPSVLTALGLGEHGCPPGRVRRDTTVAVGTAIRNTAAAQPAVVLLDDADWADDTTLDALEYAITQCEDLPLWIAVTGGPRLFEVRPAWGQRAHLHDLETLPPLPPDAAKKMIAHLLLPADRPAQTTLDRIADSAAYNPASIVELVASLHREGIVRQYEGGNAWFVDEEAFGKLPSSPVRQWAASRMLQLLPKELADLLRICAVLGVEFSHDEVDAVQRTIGSNSQIDPAVGLTQLEQRDILVSLGDDRYAFLHPAMQKGIYIQLGDEGKTAAHNSAFGYWSLLLGNAGTDQLHRIAYHASRGGHLEVAITAYMALGHEAVARNAHRAAATAFSHVLDCAEAHQVRHRLAALIARGKARRGYTHYEEARADLQAAQRLAEELGDDEALVEALVEEATACDFCSKLKQSADLIERAEAIAEDGVGPHVRSRLLGIRGVVAFRQGDWQKAIECFNMGALLGRALDAHESEIGPTLLLPLALLAVGKPKEGLAILNELIRTCEDRGDYEHLASAYANRCEFWAHFKEVEKARADIEKVKQLAQQGGFVIMELFSYHNLGELLLRIGDTDGALRATEEAYRQNLTRFSSSPLQVVNLLHAHVLCHAGEFEAACEVLENTNAAEDRFNEWLERTIRAAATAGHAQEDDWQSLIEFSRDAVSPEHVVTTMWLRARCSARAGHAEEAAKEFQSAIEEALQIESDMARAILLDRSQVSLPGGDE